MPTQDQYTQAVLKAQRVNAGDVNALVLCEMGGSEANWGQALCQYRQIAGAAFYLEIGDYVSEKALYFYNTMLAIIGLKYPGDIQLDPNAQLPAGIIVIEGGGANPTLYTYDQDDILLDEINQTWYLDFKDTNNVKILTQPYNITSSNGTHNYPIAPYVEDDISWGYKRIYGFPPNTNLQSIIVYTI